MKIRDIFRILFGITVDIPDPKDRLKLNQIKVKKDKVVIDQKNVMISSIANTESMNPVIDQGHNALFVEAKKKDLIEGDIISFERNGMHIMHRIITIGKDKEGWYCITKGDNNLYSDGKVRFEKIKKVLIGILY